MVTWVCYHNVEEGEKGGSLVSLASQPSLVGEFQINERLYLRNKQASKRGGRLLKKTPEFDGWPHA